MKSFFLTLILFLNVLWINAEIIRGKVETESGTPISGVNIYLDGSSMHTESKSDGSFELDIKNQHTGTIVFQKSGYESNSIAIKNVLGKIVKVQLIRVQEIEELTIIPYTEEAYKNYINYFLQQFLGLGLDQIKIKNQRSLKFSYDKKNKILKVKAPQTLLIENKKLGYEIKYNLEKFESDFERKIVSFYGTSFFKEINSKDQIKINRMNSFIGSVPHFLRSVYNNTVDKEGYIVNYIIRQKNPNYPSEKELEKVQEYMNFVKNNPSIKIADDVQEILKRKSKESEFVMLLTKSKLAVSDYTKMKEGKPFLTVADLLQVNYKKYPFYSKKGKILQSEIPLNQTSMIYINGELFQIFADGNISNVENFLVDGSFSENKLENMLPSDYQLGD